MKSPRLPDTASNPTQPPGPPPDPHEGYVYHSTSELLQSWSPRTRAEAKAMLEDSMCRANALVNVLAKAYPVEEANLHFSLTLLVDLLDVAFSTMEWWDMEEEGQP
jgi:hypothetical protein